MFCTNCGKEFEGQFCPNCGTTVGGQAKQNDEMLSSATYLASAYDEIEPLMNDYTNMEVRLANLEYELKHPNIPLSSEDVAESFVNLTGGLIKGFFHLILIICTCGLSLIVRHFLNKNKNNNSQKKSNLQIKEEKYKENIKKQISDTNEEKIILENQIRAFKENDSWIKAKSLLPKEIFQNSDIIYSIRNYVKLGRVDTWKEAYNLYLDESHKARMEELAIAQLDLAEQSLQVQKEICETTTELLNASVEMRNQLFKMSKSLQRQQEIMLDIRKNTNQTAKSARLAAFCSVIGLF